MSARRRPSVAGLILGYGCIILAGAVIASAGIAALLAIWGWIL